VRWRTQDLNFRAEGRTAVSASHHRAGPGCLSLPILRRMPDFNRYVKSGAVVINDVDHAT
jgi:hypothetical protein